MRHLILEGISEISDDGSVSILLKQQGKYADVLCLTLNNVTITNQEWGSLEGEPRLLGKRETKKLLRNLLQQLATSPQSKEIYFWKTKRGTHAI